MGTEEGSGHGQEEAPIPPGLPKQLMIQTKDRFAAVFSSIFTSHSIFGNILGPPPENQPIIDLWQAWHSKSHMLDYLLSILLASYHE